MPPPVVCPTVRLAVRRAVVTGLFILTLALASARPLQAQTPAVTAPSAASPDPTLHVYTNLEQIPTLVLTQDHLRLRSVDTTAFRVRLNSGRPFSPRHVRREGDDPISLAILIDASSLHNDLLPQLAESISALAPDYLHPQDHVAIYRFGCDLIRTLYFKPADPALLKVAVVTAMSTWRSDEEAEQAKVSAVSCKPTMPLWDSMAKALQDLEQQNGRRVLLVISDGEDGRSKTKWSEVMHRAQTDSTAVFAFTNLDVQTKVNNALFADKFLLPLTSAPGTARHWTAPPANPEDKLDQICELSGGLEFQTEQRYESFELKEFTQMLRERYILEYPRGNDRQPGVYTLEVSLKGSSNLYIRPSGIAVPIATHDELNGLNVNQPADPSTKPTEGKRRVLQPPPSM